MGMMENKYYYDLTDLRDQLSRNPTRNKNGGGTYE